MQEIMEVMPSENAQRGWGGIILHWLRLTLPISSNVKRQRSAMDEGVDEGVWHGLSVGEMLESKPKLKRGRSFRDGQIRQGTWKRTKTNDSAEDLPLHIHAQTGTRQGPVMLKGKSGSHEERRPDLPTPPVLARRVSSRPPEERKQRAEMLHQRMHEDLQWRHKLVIVLVGLPARGKSFVGSKVVGFLKWQGIAARVFNAGSYRRESMVGQKMDAQFFASNVSENGPSPLDDIAMKVLEQALDWLAQGGDVAVFDATNSTRERRTKVLNACIQRSHRLSVLFVESICKNPEQLRRNLISKVAHSPDYRHMPLEEALADLRKRIANYELRYRSIGPEEIDCSYIQLMDSFSHVVCNKIHGRLQHLCAEFFMSIHLKPRSIYLVRAGAHDIMARLKSHDAAPLPRPRVCGIPGVNFALPLARTLSSSPRTIAPRTLASAPHSPPSRSLPKVPSEKELQASTGISTQRAGGRAGSSGGASKSSLDNGRTEAYGSSSIPTGTSNELLAKEELSTFAIGSAALPLSEPGARFADWLGSFMRAELERKDKEEETGPPEVRRLTGPSSSSSSSSPSSSSSSSSSSSTTTTTTSTTTTSGAATTTVPTDPSRPPANPASSHLQIFVSPLARALETADPVVHQVPGAEMREDYALRMLDTGICHGLSLREVQELYPAEHKAWTEDKFHYRFPGGESQRDLVGQLLPVVLELERQEGPTMVVSHLSTLQVLYGYFLGLEVDPEEYWDLAIPQHCVVRMTPHHYGWLETRFTYTESISEDAESIDYSVKAEEIHHSTKFYK
eukprot:g80400.t1